MHELILYGEQGVYVAYHQPCIGVKLWRTTILKIRISILNVTVYMYM